MEIKAKCRYDRNVLNALMRFNIRRKAKSLVLIYVAAVLLFFLVNGFKFTAPAIISSVIAAVFVWAGWFLIFRFLIPAVNYKSLGKTRDLERLYVFKDESFEAFFKDDGYSAESKVDYEYLAGAAEDSRYFFLMLTPGSVFPVDKETIEGGTTAEIRNRLSESLKDKFKTRVR